MTDGARYFRPPHAVTAWCDDQHVYVEVPGDPPYISRYPLSEAGFSKALNLLRTRYHESPARYAHIEHGSVSQEVLKMKNSTPDQRANALNVLRKLGMLYKP